MSAEIILPTQKPPAQPYPALWCTTAASLFCSVAHTSGNRLANAVESIGECCGEMAQ